MSKKHIPFTVETFDPSTEIDVTPPVQLDLTKHHDRARLQKHLVWAINNGHSVSVHAGHSE